MPDLTIQPYEAADFSRCLAIFDGNVPQFFAPSERNDFIRFLCEDAQGSAGAPYLVVQHQRVVVACGGLQATGRRASLTWGMVERSAQGQGLGRALTVARLHHARTMPELEAVVIETSQHTAGFYQRFGFDVTKITKDGFGLGLDRWEMVLALDHAVRRDGVD